ncbi:MAG: electron transfer flavoprotein subunit alpha/FixB family protein [Natrialbaceae archaeon]|nr:electron transfer flavoprotein subunit alpha/FixB family protein [Natrialbaceae archaeon]
MTLDPSDVTVDELREAVADIDSIEDLETIRDAEADGKNRTTALEAIDDRLEDLSDGDEPAGDAPDEEDTEEETEADTEAEEEDPLDHPTRDKRHIRALNDGHYEDMWVFCETQQGELLEVSKEMLGKARELMDDYAEDYDRENVVAFIIGDDCEELANEAVAYGADVAVYHDDDRLGRFLHKPYTEIAAHMARGEGSTESTDWRDYDKPRYILFPATNNGRDLSAQVQAELDSGLASDCSDLFIETEKISNPVKTGEPGEKLDIEKVLHMKRPDFSGFEYSTILCIDNPDRDFHPQGCSVIPGSFEPIEPDETRDGIVVEHEMDLEDDWFRVEIADWDQLEAGIDLADFEVVVCLGRGIADDPTLGMELGLELTDAFEDAALGITRGIVTSSYQFDGHVEQYAGEQRQIGETGQVVEPDLYIAAGVSGAVQHKVGMDDSETIISINTDTDARIENFSDYFIEGDLFEVLPNLTEAVKTGTLDVKAVADGGDTT